MARFDVVDMGEIANPPTSLEARQSALDGDCPSMVRRLAARYGVAGRLVLNENDPADVVQDRLRAAGMTEDLDVKTVHLLNLVYFYVNGPQPDEFVRQFRKRDPAAG